MSEMKFSSQHPNQGSSGISTTETDSSIKFTSFHNVLVEHRSLLESVLIEQDEANSPCLENRRIQQIVNSRKALLNAFGALETDQISGELRIRIEQIKRIDSEMSDVLANSNENSELILSLIRSEFIVIENAQIDAEQVLVQSYSQTLASSQSESLISRLAQYSPRALAGLFEAGTFANPKRAELLKRIYYSSALRDYTGERIPNFEDPLTRDILTALAVCRITPVDQAYLQRRLRGSAGRRVRNSSWQLNHTESQWMSVFTRISSKHQVTIEDVVNRLKELLPPKYRQYKFNQWGCVTLARYIHKALVNGSPRSLRDDLRESLDPETREMLSDILGTDVARKDQRDLSTEIPTCLLDLSMARLSIGERSVLIPFPLVNIPAVAPVGTIQDLLFDGLMSPEDYLEYARIIRKTNHTLLHKYGLTLIEDVFTPLEIIEIEKLSEVTIESLTDSERLELADEITRVILTTCDLNFQENLPSDIKRTLDERRRMISSSSTPPVPRDETLRRLLHGVLTEPRPFREKKGYPKKNRNRFFERVNPFFDFRLFRTPQDLNDLYRLYAIFKYLNVKSVADRTNRWKEMVSKNLEAFKEWKENYAQVLINCGLLLPSSLDGLEFIESVLGGIKTEMEGHRRGQGKPTWLQIVHLLETFDRISYAIHGELAEHGVRFEIIDSEQRKLTEGNPIHLDQNPEYDWIADLGEDN